MVFWDTNGSPYHGQMTRSYNNKQQQKKRTRKIVEFDVPVDHIVKLKESEKKTKYVDLTREFKKKHTVGYESDDDTNCEWCS